jgi:hypothetical protein
MNALLSLGALAAELDGEVEAEVDDVNLGPSAVLSRLVYEKIVDVRLGETACGRDEWSSGGWLGGVFCGCSVLVIGVVGTFCHSPWTFAMGTGLADIVAEW